MTLFGIGPMELMVILVLALIVFGPNRLPEIARQIGKAVSEFRRTSEQVTSAVMREMNAAADEQERKKKAASQAASQDTVAKPVAEIAPPTPTRPDEPPAPTPEEAAAPSVTTTEPSNEA